MGIQLTHSDYGTARVRLLRVTRRDSHHDVKDRTLSIRLEGDFAVAHSAGDNRKILPEDTLRNTIYVLAKQYSAEAIEEFALHVIEHFLTYNPQVSQAEIAAHERPWVRMPFGEKGHPTAFLAGSEERRMTRIRATRQQTTLQSGIENLTVLRTADCSFTDFLRDPYTTVRDAGDRILSSSLSAVWTFADAEASYSTVYHGVRKMLLETFATHESKSLQHTLYAMGQAVLDNFDMIREIRLSLPEKQYLLLDLKPFGMENYNEVFQPMEEPQGIAEATLRREE
jgi:urate oxidase